MKKFVFKLQSVLKYRKHLENLVRQELMKVLMDVTNCEKRIKEMRQAQQALADRVERKTVKGIPAMLFRQYNDYMDSIKDDIALKMQEHQQLKQLLAVKQQLLTKKSVDRKVIERLREKKRAEYLEEMMAEEQKIADEVSSLKKAREGSHDAS